MSGYWMLVFLISSFLLCFRFLRCFSRFPFPPLFSVKGLERWEVCVVDLWSFSVVVAAVETFVIFNYSLVGTRPSVGVYQPVAQLSKQRFGATRVAPVPCQPR